MISCLSPLVVPKPEKQSFEQLIKQTWIKKDILSRIILRVLSSSWMISSRAAWTRSSGRETKPLMDRIRPTLNRLRMRKTKAKHLHEMIPSILM